MRSAYHVRELDVYRLLQIHRHLDVFVSHDWPRGIANFGNKAQLFRAKPFLQREVIATLFWRCRGQAGGMGGGEGGREGGCSQGVIVGGTEKRLSITAPH